ncbi:MAG: Gfo/Idh/MocA family oxidoreductase [Planctomycetes bacterium]|nr:Gfo/Idh/MocA family oxidoreductase [Planctomycetota bacterium]
MKSSIPKPSTVTRRTFVKTAAGLTAGASFGIPAMVGSVLSGAESKLAASERIGIAMIGMGRQAYYANLKPFLHSKYCQVVAVCDVDSWRLDNAKKAVEQYYASGTASGSYKGCAATQDFREILSWADVDAVMISTPDHWHVPMAIMAAKAKKDIACEKPLTLSIAEGRKLADTVKRYGRVFRTDSEFRSLRCFQHACELVLNGYIGKLHTIRSAVPAGDVGCRPQAAMPVPDELDYDMWLGPAPKKPYTLKRVHPPKSYGRPGWMRVRDYCEGMVTNWGTHLNDIAQWANGTERTGPVEVEGKGEYPKEGLWNVLLNFDIEYKYANGVKLYYKTDRPYVRFEGSEGWIQADFSGQKLDAHPKSLLKIKLKPDEIHLPLLSEKEDFIQAVRTQGPTLADAEVGHRTCSLCQLGHIAIQTGKKLCWNPDKEQFTNDETANRLCHKSYRAPWRI